MKYLKKFKEIAVGWKNVAFKDQVIEDMAFDRASICSECIHNVDNKCELCGCPLIAKTRSPESKCPTSKWKV